MSSELGPGPFKTRGVDFKPDFKPELGTDMSS